MKDKKDQNKFFCRGKDKITDEVEEIIDKVKEQSKSETNPELLDKEEWYAFLTELNEYYGKRYHEKFGINKEVSDMLFEELTSESNKNSYCEWFKPGPSYEGRYVIKTNILSFIRIYLRRQ